MTDATFEKVGGSDKRLYGPVTLLMCGFPAEAHAKFNTLLQMIGFGHLPKVWVSTEQKDAAIADLVALPDETGNGAASDMPRAIVVGGVTESELLRLMSACKQAGMAKTLWATLTPTSVTWTIKQLLTELAAERDALEK